MPLLCCGALVEEGITVATPLLALAEVAGAIARQTDDSDLAEKITGFLHTQSWIQFVPLTDDLAIAATTIAARQRLRGADAVYVALAAQRSLSLITLDREMRERTKETVDSATPTAWLKQH
jgi:predicted nucleic acid-binding protein